MVLLLRPAFIIALLCIMITLHACMTFRMSPKEIDSFFSKHHVHGTQHEYKSGWRDVHYVQAGDETKPLVLFVHGSPGSLSAFIDYLADTSLLSRALLVTVDRPGFGYSNFGSGEPSLQKQAATLKPILEKYKDNRPIVLVGHSLGGPLIARMAMDYPGLVDALVFVAASVDPDLEPSETWFRAPLASPFLRWALPRSFRASNDELYHLKTELEEMVPLWDRIHCPSIVIQGKKDALVPAANADFLKRKLTQAPVSFVFKDDMNHFVPWSDPDLVKNAIKQLLHQSVVAEGE